MLPISLLFTFSIAFAAPAKRGWGGSHTSPGFNWAHAAVGAGAGIGASALWNQQQQINQLQGTGGGAVSSASPPSSPAIVVVPLDLPASASNQATSQQPASGNGLIHSVKDQELILNTDAGPKIFEQKN